MYFEDGRKAIEDAPDAANPLSISAMSCVNPSSCLRISLFHVAEWSRGPSECILMIPRPFHSDPVHSTCIPSHSPGISAQCLKPVSRTISFSSTTPSLHPTTGTSAPRSESARGQLPAHSRHGHRPRHFTTDAGVFARAAGILPSNLPVMEDPKFLADRENMFGRSWQKSDVERGRPEAMVHMRKAFDVLEALLADGREWIAATEEVSLADIEAAWPFDWLLELKALPAELFSETLHPKTFAWLKRFRSAIKTAKSSTKKPVTLKGQEAFNSITSAQLHDGDETIDDKDPLALKAGSEVEVWPIDSGFKQRDRGQLVKLTKDEVSIAVKCPVGSKEIHLHAPRWGFRVAEVGATGAKL
ncbi:hypothetical protein M8818_000620 [Zalaria obscura]|uniref:Uncharacterized protein n=1 Tax=Zalaria obscura TaxID=2024903 RepID=A0ACC3SMY7_9PEZI